MAELPMLSVLRVHLLIYCTAHYSVLAIKHLYHSYNHRNAVE